ncbi:hypothetical protein ACFFUB_02310 [Algimonas porphyrae]|uniref:Uncharacterized protein n=1 Tax=Algimonas porphyrae TaxID=1128113 RepID=A0ABQ5UYR5_9PROT|nr:hypothetical protein [Algimonas porphyrae]GLQ20411.1 hypothetical protein GCM10007854_13660 [Algimonas porphyrae]
MSETPPELTLLELQAIADQLRGKAKPDLLTNDAESRQRAEDMTSEKTGEGNVLISRRLLRRLLDLAAKGLKEN